MVSPSPLETLQMSKLKPGMPPDFPYTCRSIFCLFHRRADQVGGIWEPEAFKNEQLSNNVIHKHEVKTDLVLYTGSPTIWHMFNLRGLHPSSLPHVSADSSTAAGMRVHSSGLQGRNDRPPHVLTIYARATSCCVLNFEHAQLFLDHFICTEFRVRKNLVANLMIVKS